MGKEKGVIEKATEAVQKIAKIKKIFIALGALLPVLKVFLIVMLVSVITFLPIMFFNNIKEGFFSGVDKLFNFLSLDGWMSSENNYYKTLEKEYEKFMGYNYRDGEFDIPLLAATTHYVNTFGPESFEYANENKDQVDYNEEDMKYAIRPSESRSFYTVANDQLGTSTSFIPTQKKLIGHLVDVKIVTHCKTVEGLADMADVASIYWDNWKDFASYTVYSTGQLIKKANIFKFVKLIYSYKKQGHSYTSTQYNELKGYLKNDNIVKEFLRIIEQSDFSNCDEDNEVPVPVLYRFINYENYKRYLKETYLPHFYINCKNCPYKDKSSDMKEKIAENMVEEIFAQKKAWDYLNDSVSRTFAYIPGMTTIPVQSSSGSSWREGISRGWQLGTAKCFVNGVWNGKRNCSHLGIDFTGPIGTPIYAIASGKVEIANHGSTGYGNYIKLSHDVDNDGKIDYYSLYAHLSSILVSKGDIVQGGELIGKMGSTGNSSGSHLHFEIRNKNDIAINPEPILDAIDQGLDNPLEGTITCGMYNAEQLNNLNSELKNKINSAGFGTREAVVSVASYLAEGSGVKIPYWWGGKSLADGFDPEWGCGKAITAGGSSKQPKGSVHPFGLDCSGFTKWAIHAAGFKSNNIPEGACNQSVNIPGTQKIKFNSANFNKVKVGDLVWYGNMAKTEGHIGIIVSIADKNTCKVRVAEAANSKTGVRISDTNCNLNRFTHFVSMDGFYNNATYKR